MKIELKPYTPDLETQKWREKMRAYRQAKARGEIPQPEKSEEGNGSAKRNPLPYLGFFHDPACHE